MTSRLMPELRANACHSLGVLAAALLIAGCAAPAQQSQAPSDSAAATPSASVAPSPTPEVSTPESVSVTFRLTLTGVVPSDATFALQAGIVDGAQHAIYLCSYYGGYPICESGGTYDDVWSGPPGTRLSYRFWRELDANGAEEAMKAGELAVGLTDQVVSVTYDIQP